MELFTNPVVIAVLVLHVIAIADVWASRLTNTAKVLWSLVLLFMPVVGLVAWLLTRASAYGPLEELPPQDPAEEA